MSNYIEPRIRRDFGGVMTAYIDFLKENHKHIFVLFMKYNFIFIIALFLLNYFSESGLNSLNYYFNGDVPTVSDFDNQLSGIVFSAIASIVVTVILGMTNAAFIGVYMRLYEQRKTGIIEGKELWSAAVRKMPGMLVILLMAFFSFFLVGIVSFIALIIPLLGIFVFFLIMVAFATWIGMALFAYGYNESMSPFKALGSGWTLLFSKFWKAIGVSFITSILIYMLSAFFQLLPMIIIGVISFNSAMDQTAVNETIFVQVLSFIYYALSSFATIIAYILILFAQGFLYLNLHEERFNIYLKTRIQKLGQSYEA